MTDEKNWKEALTTEQYHVLRERGTEVPGTGKYLYTTSEGDYHCAGCRALLFTSQQKYESTIPGLIGWPSFADPAASDAVLLSDDSRQGMNRTEVTCRNCGGHLGHLFPDETSPTGQHYCINSVALDFQGK